MCYLDWFVCFLTPKDARETKILQECVFFFLEAIQQSSITRQAMRLIRCCQVSFPSSAFKAKRLNSGSESWIEICHLLQVRTETSIEANQFYTVCTMFFFFPYLDINFFLLVTHIINHNLGIALPIPKGNNYILQKCPIIQDFYWHRI